MNKWRKINARNHLTLSTSPVDRVDRGKPVDEADAAVGQGIAVGGPWRFPAADPQDPSCVDAPAQPSVEGRPRQPGVRQQLAHGPAACRPDGQALATSRTSSRSLPSSSFARTRQALGFFCGRSGDSYHVHGLLRERSHRSAYTARVALRPCRTEQGADIDDFHDNQGCSGKAICTASTRAG